MKWTDSAGRTSTYHLLGKPATVTGLIVYLDGDGSYGHKNPDNNWALGGTNGIVKKGAAKGYVTLSIAPPGGADTFWKKGSDNAKYVAALIKKIKADLGVNNVVLVGYSGGSQLITKWLLPTEPHLAKTAVIFGGGGAPTSAIPAKMATKLVFITGTADTAANAEDGYDAYKDSKAGAAKYRAAGWNVTEVHPSWVNHDGLGTRFGTYMNSYI